MRLTRAASALEEDLPPRCSDGEVTLRLQRVPPLRALTERSQPASPNQTSVFLLLFFWESLLLSSWLLLLLPAFLLRFLQREAGFRPPGIP